MVATHQPVAVTGTAQRVGVQGMGGIGKSVLAAAVARDEAVRGAFADGVIWLSLGQEPRLGMLQAQLATALGASPQALMEGQGNVGELLQDKACLLVLDDVWQMEHLKPFHGIGPRCQMLMTTRDSTLVRGLGATEHQLDVFSEPEALTLLAKWSKQKLETLPSEAHEVMQECGRLPLALAMVGAIVQNRPELWGDVLYRLRHADLEEIEQEFPDYPYPNLLKAIQVSVEVLEPKVRERYFDFAVFPEDTLMPESVLQTLWEPEGLNQYDARKVLYLLIDRSLMRRDEQGRLSLHDLQRDYIQRQVSDLTKLHQRLLSTYGQCCPNDWCSGPRDGYFFERLAYHLLQASRKQELYALLTASPAWMEAKFIACTGDSAYVADLELALQGLVEPLTPAELVTLVQLHTARQIVHKRISRYSDEDLKTLAWLGREAEALSHARLRANAKEKFDGLFAISEVLREKGQLDPKLQDEVYEVAQAIAGNRQQTEALSHLAAALVQAGRATEATALFTQAQQVAQAIADDGERAEALSHLAAALAQAGHFTQAQQVAQALENNWRRADVLRQLVAALAQAGRFPQALTTLGLQDGSQFLAVLAKWVPAFERIETGLSMIVLREALAIWVWAEPEWREVYQVFQGEEG